MKPVLVVIMLFLFQFLRAQSDSLEQVALLKDFSSQSITQDVFARKLNDWKMRLKERNGYPDLPLDKAGQVHYSFIRKYGFEAPEILFDRSMEWLSINYGLIPAYVYSNRANGKIICRNGVTLKNNFTCNYTMIITISRGQVFTEFINISYQPPATPDNGGNTGSFLISQLYPVILKPKSEWDQNLQLMRITNAYFPGETDNLDLYISTYKETYEAPSGR